MKLMRYAALTVLVVGVLLALLAVVTPWVARYQTAAYVAANELGELEIGELAFNPLLLSVRAGGVNWQYQGKQVLAIDLVTIDLAWGPLLDGEIEVSSLAMNGGQILVQQTPDGWIVVPLPDVAQAPATDPQQLPARESLVWFVNDLAATDLSIEIDGHNIKSRIRLDEVVLHSLGMRAGAKTDWTIAGNLNDASFSLKGEAPLMDAGQSFQMHLKIDAWSVAPFLGLSGLHDLSGLLSADLRLSGVMEGTLDDGQLLPADMTVAGNIDWQQFTASMDNYSVASDLLEWRGQVVAKGQYPDVVPAHQGDVSVTGLTASDAVSGIAVSLEALSLNVGVNAQDLHTLATFAIDINAAVRNLSAQHVPQSLSLLTISEAQLDGAAITQDTFSLPGLSLTQIDLMQNMVTAASVTVTELETGASIRLKEAIIDSVQANITLDEAGKPVGLDPLVAIPLPQPEPNPEAIPAAKTPLSIGSVILTGQSSVIVTDQSFAPAVTHRLNIDEASIGGVESGQVDNQIPFMLAGRVDEFSSLNLEGTVAPFADQLALTMKADLAELPLHEYSAYAERAIGYEMNSGQMDLGTQFSLTGSLLDATVEVQARQFTVTRVQNSEFENALGMPLGAALNLVRDRNDDITLTDLKISGDLSSPDVSLDQIVAKALSKALVSGSMTFLKFALQPYGAVFMAAEAIGKQAGKIRLDPMVFAAGSAEISAEQQAYVTKLVDILESRPALRLVACGEASTLVDIGAAVDSDKVVAEPPVTLTLADLTDAQKKSLTDLAAERSRSLKRALVARDVPSQRVSDCKAQLNEQPDGNRLVLAID